MRQFTQISFSILPAAFAALLSITTLSGCAKSGDHPSEGLAPQLSLGPELSGNEIPPGTEKLIEGPWGSTLRVANHSNSGTQLYLEVEAVLAGEDFADLTRANRVSDALESASKNLSQLGAIVLDRRDSVGYLKFWLPYQRDLLGAIKTAKFRNQIYFNPVSYNTEELSQAKAHRPEDEGLTLNPQAALSGRLNRDGYSGLEKMGALAFVKEVQSTLGTSTSINGSTVKLGVTDTGITYNHPTFFAQDGVTNRISYMKDFTREGRVYFSPSATFSAVEDGADGVLVQAQVIDTPALPKLPNPGSLRTVKGAKFKVPAALKTLLLDPKQTIRLAYLNESAFSAADEEVDLNRNRKLDDLLPILLIQGATPELDRVWIDWSGTGNFLNSSALGSFNVTRDTAEVFAERIGFDLRKDQLVSPDTGNAVTVRSASIVGFDPGNHGSHVAGIAAGRKTIANDPDDTLARGVAPAAQILLNRVCANNGGCNATTAIIDLATQGGAEVINMSLGGLSPFNDGYGVQETVVNRLTSTQNTLFVISAGNSGPGRQTVGSPSVARLSLSVGASASRTLIERQYQWAGGGANPATPIAATSGDDDFMLFFSSRGPSAAGGFKPNISAPGTELSSIQLNSAPGMRSGLDVYWGTSMAAPAAAGAYALLLDGIKKFNAANPQQPISTNAAVIREALIQTARPFGREQYSWMDQGTGMVNLVGAWKKLLELRTAPLGTGAQSGVLDRAGKPIALDYQVLVSSDTPAGAYDGSRVTLDDAQNKIPAFGTGLYLRADSKDQLRTVHIARRLPEALESSAEAGFLSRQLETTAEEFSFSTDYGSDQPWLKVGVQDRVDCMSSDTANLIVLGRGAEITRNSDGTGKINPLGASALQICIDRAAMSRLAPGDHGALISAFRVEQGQKAKIASFMIPVSLTVPHQVLAQSTAYSVTGTVKSFGVQRNYVTIPQGTSLVQITLEVPAYKAGGTCSGVELMQLEGGNTVTGSESRAQRRVSNCTATGAPITDPSKLQLVLSRANPKAGIWDLNVFGQYKFAESNYSLRVDYVVAKSSAARIQGTQAALNGALTWTVQESSKAISPTEADSEFVLSALFHQENAQVSKDQNVAVGGPLGKLKKFPADVKMVTVTTGGSPGNDIDLEILECPDTLTSTADLAACKSVASSGGSSDVEKASFPVRPDRKYVYWVAGFEIKDAGNFWCADALEFKSTSSGNLQISGNAPQFRIQHGFDASQVAASTILNHALFTSGQYLAQGAIRLRSAGPIQLGVIEVQVTK